jgi:RNA polymerase sigma-70 factor (ECF subfamily)
MATPAQALPDNANLAAQMRPALLHYFKRKTGNAAEAEDLTQDVLVRALAHAHWTSAEQAKGYIFRAAVNRWRDHLRRLRSHGATVAWDEDAQTEVGAENPPESVLIARQELSQIVQTLGELNVRTRTVLMLIRLEQMKAAAVADMLGISVSAVNKHLANAVKHLAELRGRRGAL